MPVLASRLDTRSEAFAANAQRMSGRLAEVRELEQRVIAESASKRARFLAASELNLPPAPRWRDLISRDRVKSATLAVPALGFRVLRAD